MAAAVPLVMIAGATMQAVGAIRQGQAAKAAADFNANIATQNAQIARQEAQQQARQADRETYLRLGTITANAGKNGGTMGGSALDVLADTAYQSAWERQQILYKGELQARGFTNTAALDTMEGNAAQRASYLQAGADLLQGAGNAGVAQGRLSRG